MMEMLLHNIDINGKRTRHITGVCDKARKAKVVPSILVIPHIAETRPLSVAIAYD